jgi:hypothetical protein
MDQAAHANQFFFGYSENAVKAQIWIAISIYAMTAIIYLGHLAQVPAAPTA